MPYKSTSFIDKRSQYCVNSYTVITIANISNKVLGVIKRSAGTGNVTIFSIVYKSPAWSILEYAAPVWSPYLAMDICIEKRRYLIIELIYLWSNVTRCLLLLLS